MVRDINTLPECEKRKFIDDVKSRIGEENYQNNIENKTKEEADKLLNQILNTCYDDNLNFKITTTETNDSKSSYSYSKADKIALAVSKIFIGIVAFICFITGCSQSGFLPALGSAGVIILFGYIYYQLIFLIFRYFGYIALFLGALGMIGLIIFLLVKFGIFMVPNITEFFKWIFGRFAG